MYGLRNVRNRRTDALTQVGWDQLEVMLAVYYRGQGYRVEHVGTGGSGARFDGGIDLKLYKDDAYLVVQCKHWNAKQLTHNAVHELLGVMITQSATGAILVTSGEFTRAAIEAATRQSHVQLVDGDDLRAMLGPLPGVASGVPTVSNAKPSVGGGVAAHVGQRLLDAAEDRKRGAGRGQRRRGVIGHAMSAGLGIVLIKLVIGMIIFLVMANQINSIVTSLQPPHRGDAGTDTAREFEPTLRSVPGAGALPAMRSTHGSGPVVIDHFTGTTGEDGSGRMPAYRPPTADEVRESKRLADEAMRILERSTPEM